MYKLFVDLDGVLADFDDGVRTVTGKSPDELHPRVMWKSLARANGFYEHLSWMPDGHELWGAVSGLDPTILTGLPLGRWAEPQKRAWCTRELGKGVPVITCMSRDKEKHARAVTPDGIIPVLVDDRIRLEKAWSEMGGVFVHHRSASRSLKELGRLFPKLSEA